MTFSRNHLKQMIINHLNSYNGVPSVKFYINAVHNYFHDLDPSIYNKCIATDERKIRKLVHIVDYSNGKLSKNEINHYAGALMKTNFASMYMAQGKLKTCRLNKDRTKLPMIKDTYNIKDDYDIIYVIMKELPSIMAASGRLGLFTPLRKHTSYVKHTLDAYGYVNVGMHQILVDNVKIDMNAPTTVTIRVENTIVHANTTQKILDERSIVVKSILEAFNLMPCVGNVEWFNEGRQYTKIRFSISRDGSKLNPTTMSLDDMYKAKVKIKEETKEKLDRLNEEKVKLEGVMDETVKWLIEADKVKSMTENLLKG